jgi:predicted lipid-binding transport protein (Tim44 family)
MIAPRTTLRVARIARVPIRYHARRFASTNQQAAAAGGSSGLVGGLAGGVIVFGVRCSPSISDPSSRFQARIQLLLLLRRKVHRERSFLDQESIQQAHAKHPIIRS